MEGSPSRGAAGAAWPEDEAGTPRPEAPSGAGASTRLEAGRAPERGLRRGAPAVRPGLIDEELPSERCVIPRS